MDEGLVGERAELVASVGETLNEVGRRADRGCPAHRAVRAACVLAGRRIERGGPRTADGAGLRTRAASNGRIGDHWGMPTPPASRSVKISDDERGGWSSDRPRRDGGPRGGQFFGVALSELDASLREEFQIDPEVAGVVVLGVDIGSANEGVVRPGDVIEQMAFQPTDSMIAARAIAGEAAVGEHNIVVRINRGGQRTYRRLQARS